MGKTGMQIAFAIFVIYFVAFAIFAMRRLFQCGVWDCELSIVFREYSLATIAPEILCQTLNKAPGIVAIGYAAK